MSKLLLGIDIGSYSSKGVLCQTDGTIIAEARADHTMDFPKPGYVEHDADRVWWADFTHLAGELTAQVPQGDHIAAVGVSAIGACVLPVDKNGRPLRPGILYGVDTRAVKQIDYLEKKYTFEAILEHCGTRLSTQAVGPKILWIKENEPDIYRQTYKFLTSTSYIIYKLTGEYVIDTHTATEWVPLADIKKGTWSERFISGIASLNQLPNIGPSNKIAGTITAQAEAVTGIPAGTPVNFGAVDALSEAVSVGVINTGELMIMYGSTAFFIFFIDKPIPTKELWLEGGVFEGQYEYSAGLSTGGTATTWFRDQFAQDLIAAQNAGGKNAYGALAEEAKASPVGANGLLMLPYLSGERTPIFDPKARGIFAGMSLNHTRGDIYRAVLEGISFGIRMNLEAMQKAGVKIRHGVAVGGGASNELWLQMVSDISGIPQVLPEKTIGASYGDAFLAGLAVGAVELNAIKKQWVKVKKWIEPDLDKKKMYDTLYPLFKDLYTSTKPVIHQLTDIQK